jgi:hypothetical protein
LETSEAVTEVKPLQSASEYSHANGRDKSRPYSGLRFVGAMACLARSCISHHFTRKEFADALSGVSRFSGGEPFQESGGKMVNA